MESITSVITKQLNKRGYSNKTNVTYLYWIGCLVDFHGDRFLDDYKEEEIIEFLVNLKEVRKLSHNTVRQAITIMSFSFNKIGKKEFDFSCVQVGRSVNTEFYVPTQHEILQLIDFAPSLKYKIAFSLMYSIGLNAQELLNIEIKNIDVEKSKIKILHNNSRVYRSAIIAEKIKPALYSYLKIHSGCKWLFENNKGEQIDISGINKSLKKTSELLKLNDSMTSRILKTAYIKHLELMGIKLDVILDELVFSKDRFSRQQSLQYYSQLGIKVKKITFSPLDRILNITEEVEIMELYISDVRITHLIDIKTSTYDMTKVIQLLNEINIANLNKMYLTIPMLIRALVDHAAPIFGFNTFCELSNNYNSTKSFKKSMMHLDKSLRGIADSLLHTPIRKAEILPTFQQINFKADLDLLLSEVIRIHKVRE